MKKFLCKLLCIVSFKTICVKWCDAKSCCKKEN